MFEFNPIRKTPGQPSQSPPSIEIQANGAYIQWRYKGFIKWNNIIPIKNLQGDRGPTGASGAAGPPGPQGTAGEAGAAGPTGASGAAGPRGLSGPAGEQGVDGIDGADGREVELRVSKTHIQWRYVGESLWKDLIALSELKGPKGNDGQPGEQGEKGVRGPTGYPGSPGPRGPQGYPGAAGVGVPSGGTTGQVLAKDSDSDYDTGWVDQTGGGGASGYELINGPLYDATYVYVGYEHQTSGAWYIYRRTRATNVRLYASGSSDYATNWTDRESLIYS